MNLHNYLKDNELTVQFWTKFKKRVVFLDFETTGINFDSDRIIEIGALALKDNGTGEEYHTLINPQVQIAPVITSLTGISNDMVCGAPLIESQTEAFNAFFNDSIVVAHNANFEKNFIARFFPDAKCFEFIDSCEIAMLLLPALKYFNLEKILNFFGIKENEDHRALLDAKDTYYALNHMVSYALANPNADFLKTLAAGIDKSANASTAQFFHNLYAAYKQLAKGGAKKKKAAAGPAKSETEVRGQISFGFMPEPNLEESLAAIAGHGAIESGYLLQSSFVADILNAFDDDKYLLAEIPHKAQRINCILHAAGLYSKRTRENVLIIESHAPSTGEIAKHHLPHAEESFGGEVKFGILKDPENYICRCNFNILESSAATEEENFFVLYIKSYLAEYPDGNLENVAPFLTNKYPGLKEKLDFIKASEFFCRNERCDMHKNCFFRKAIYEFQNSDVLISPPNNFFRWRDMIKSAKKNNFRVIVDQAHKFEDTFTESFAVRFNRPEVMSALDDSLKFCEKAFEGRDGHDDAMNCKSSLEHSIAQANDFFGYAEGIYSHIAKDDISRSGASSIILLERTFEDTNIQENFLEKLINLSIIFKQSETHFEKLARLIPKNMAACEKDYAEIVYNLNKHIRNMRKFREYFLTIIQSVDATYTAYLKYDFYRKDWGFCTEPVDIGKILSKQLFPFSKSMVFVSSSLSVNSDYDFIKWILGLQKCRNLEVKSYEKFRDAAQHSFIIPKEMPYFDSKNTAGFVAKLGEIILKIASKKGGRTMVLFNSIERMNQVYKNVSESFSKLGITCSCQRSEILKSKMLEQLSKNENCVIFGSQSLMDFPDIEDESIDTLIIEKLPFPFFEDPKIISRKKLAAARGLQEFEDYILPKTILKIKQTIGRIKSDKNGKGLLVIADSKLINAKYLREISSSIPVGNTYYTFEEYWRDHN
ncbi:MAG TPA: exonuclease domain-containing protein [Candidatus Wallbacteria bacterium]|nr:exonuclease domain-containing protein [Candidatus Wallbacteria bacterium]